MSKIKINWSTFWFLMFIVTTYITYAVNSTHFDLTKAADYEYYRDYLYYFFGENETTNKEQGLIYFFIVSYILKVSEMDFGFYGVSLFFSNGILITNYLLYLLGLAGLYKLLRLQNINFSNIFFTFVLINFFPPTIYMILNMKPEILAFSTLPWSLFLIFKFIETSDIKFIYLSLFPNLVLLTSKGTIIASVGLIYAYILLKNYKTFNSKQFYKFISLSIFLISIIFYENYIANSKFILDHENLNPLYQNTASFSFLWNINFDNLLFNPFSNFHANSFLGIILLDTFGDYFSYHAFHDNSLYSFSRKKLPGVWYISYWTQFISIFLTLIFYYSIFKFIKAKKYNTLFYILPIFGLFPLILQAYGIPSLNFNSSTADAFKSHYYSYLLVISFAFVVVAWIQKYKMAKPIMFLLIIFTYVNLYGFIKNDVGTYKEALSVRNNYSFTCALNQDLSFGFLNSNCNNSEVKICEDSPHLSKLNYVKNSTNSNLEYEPYTKKQELSNGKLIVVPVVFEECMNFVNSGYSYKSFINNSIVFPKINIAMYLLSIFSMIYIFFKVE